VPHKRCGKLPVAVDEAEIGKLRAIKAQAEANGVMDLVWLTGAEARALPKRCSRLRPVDSHALMLALRGDAEDHGAMLAFETPALSGRVNGRGLVTETGGTAQMEAEARLVVNAAGLGAQALARSIAGMPADKSPPCISPRAITFRLSVARRSRI